MMTPASDWNPLQSRKDFPLLAEKAYDKPLIYFDNAATTQKPQAVIDAVRWYYETQNANIHRGVFCLSEKATVAYENARIKVKKFINAASEKEIIFTRGTTESINLVAQTFGRKFLKAGDEILVTALEHHSNIVPWQMICEEKGAVLRVLPVSSEGDLDLNRVDALLTPKTKLFAVVHISNAIGTVNPVKELIRRAHAKKIPVLVDGAQSVGHMPVDVRDLDADFFAFSGHKVFAPTGIGVLYGKTELLEAMPPYQGGGDMIEKVSFEKTTYNQLPYKFEAGTPHIAGVIALGAALDYLSAQNLALVHEYETELTRYAVEKLARIDGLKIIGQPKERAAIISFTLSQAHPQDIGTILDREGIAIRTGHHCAMPLMQILGLTGTARASFSFYNTKQEIDQLANSLLKVIELFK
ncbi:MAG TPA: cysteine desulfurase [Candidatus Omnitrophota bacterium]|nr:cysteine desulfurase [Candidatus Omnitrophota bacterium]